MRISDWSSDVCSSDLVNLRAGAPAEVPVELVEAFLLGAGPAMLPGKRDDRTEARVLSIRLAERAEDWAHVETKPALRSEERRVGKECVGRVRLRGVPEH